MRSIMSTLKRIAKMLARSGATGFKDRGLSMQLVKDRQKAILSWIVARDPEFGLEDAIVDDADIQDVRLEDIERDLLGIHDRFHEIKHPEPLNGGPYPKTRVPHA